MSTSTLYDDDILLWSEQQAAALRALAGRRDLPNELDLENLIEEVEDLGRSYLHSAESLIENILVHLGKLSIEPHSDPVRHWRAEVIAFRTDLARKLAASMRQRIDLDKLWINALRRMREVYGRGVRDEEKTCPFSFDDLLAIDNSLDDGIARVRSALRIEEPVAH